MSSYYRRRGPKLAVPLFTLLALFTLLLSACGGSGQSSTNTDQKHVLTIATQSTNFSLPGFNPYSTSPNFGINGFVYETLEFCNVNDGNYAPLLATDHSWSKDLTQVTFHTRQNVKWNDGQSFSAEDVAFTFNAIKQYPAADTANAWSYLKSVEATDANTVVMTLKKPYVPALYFIATQVVIIPKHVFASVGDVTKYNNDKVVGTGPFTLKRYTSDLMVLDRNPGFWQADKVKVDEIRMPYYNGNESAQTVMPTGKIDWSGYYDENLQKSFIDKDPAHNHYFMDAINMVGIFVDINDPLLSQVPVRKAISAALDREGFAKQAVAGFEPPVAQHGLVLPAGKDYLDPTYANLSTKPDPAQAEKYLKDAGFTKGADGIYAKDGKRLSFELISVVGFSDWNAIAQMAQAELKTVGIEIKIKLMAESAYRTFRASTQPHQLMLNSVTGGPSPYYVYYGTLASSSIPPNGRNSSFWKDGKTDQLLQEFATSDNKDQQKQAIQELQKIMVEQVPFIPVLGGARWCEYTSTRFTGWPSEQNPYSSCAPYAFPDNEYIILHLQPAS
ncbi:ABC transporter substrate-binding protein [Ktedonosporobacter rubrisoli]|uniref:ABC transporter substrate-binding protein n=1 Tax=Ktedonosporobacter rubrisoli TaxID=2509675 RepID=UPI0013EE57A9|nr:ABC transporter substrate-binding protein [Ktedonosporobacter rubrisoli]